MNNNRSENENEKIYERNNNSGTYIEIE